MADDPKAIQQQVQQQNDDNYQDDSYSGSAGGADPMVIDDAMKQATGEEPYLDEAANVARKINEDEEAVVDGTIPPGSDAVVNDDEEKREE